MERIIFPASFFEERASLLNMWGHRFNRLLGSQSFPQMFFFNRVAPNIFLHNIFVSRCCYGNMKLVYYQLHISFVWKKINTTENAIQRLQCQRFRGKIVVPLIINPTYTLYSGYHPKGPPPPFFPVNSGDWCDFHCALGWRFSGQMCWTYSFSWCTFTVPGTSSFGRGRCQAY